MLGWLIDFGLFDEISAADRCAFEADRAPGIDPDAGFPATDPRALKVEVAGAGYDPDAFGQLVGPACSRSLAHGSSFVGYAGLMVDNAGSALHRWLRRRDYLYLPFYD